MGFIKRIKEEIAVIRQRDPAIHSAMEVFLYPSFKVMLHYRIAHKLYLKKHYFLARWISQRGVRKTGIEIHQGAEIGKICNEENGRIKLFNHDLVKWIFGTATQKQGEKEKEDMHEKMHKRRILLFRVNSFKNRLQV